ncbi:MAG: hypothetical protein KME03_03175 [Aphanocapsa lilacina HA4352-LM1]|nr:hypothetical protein [Aphanocapsa lilacina HA4352-LM1]
MAHYTDSADEREALRAYIQRPNDSKRQPPTSLLVCLLDLSPQEAAQLYKNFVYAAHSARVDAIGMAAVRAGAMISGTNTLIDGIHQAINAP